MTHLPRITAGRRRARLVRRHLLTPAVRVDGAHEVADALIGLHATDPATVFLAAAARMRAPTPDVIDQALYARQSDVPTLERIRCMRRTMFVVPARLAPAVLSATAQSTDRLRAEAMDKLNQALGWDQRHYTAVQRDALAALAERGAATAAQLAADVPALREQLVVFPGKSYESRQRAASTVLGVLAAEGHIRRARPAGSWTSAQFRWTPARPLPAVPVAEARATLARHYLAAYGPATADDVKWWTGWNLTDTRKAIVATGAQAVELDEGTGYLLPEDLEDLEELEDVEDVGDLEGLGPVAPHASGAVLLPGLDPTPMGWRHRQWYLEPAHTAALFDRNGNIGPTVWWGGRIIGAWAQHADGHINHHLLTDAPAAARAAVDEEIGRLTAFLSTTRVTPAYSTPLERRLATGGPD
ncbi:winged helix DNA-binding domain-containing protein [Streptomyces sp. NBC_01381]|uniref:winged helix DNA-binding domain-containing protein n=1 Tax=Streptomyces sp. NBC_01381 TaxID=2903845 RepID=UPI00224D2271|nr:winged helix DNA-binding domain-containing protein [Streptomyces sp. NBC_01381]MCX4671408.1 winged helix DNA-binding domain-containing protein [Streptomyces sp. NBC_01381]